MIKYIQFFKLLCFQIKNVYMNKNIIYLQSSGSQPGHHSPCPRGHLAMQGDIFACHNRGELATSIYWVNAQAVTKRGHNAQDSSKQQRNPQPKMIVVLSSRTLALKENKQNKLPGKINIPRKRVPNHSSYKVGLPDYI